MKDFYIFIKSLEYIEQNLSTDLSQEEIASYCACSVSALQKMWKYCTNQGVMSYIKKRRFTLAARELVEGAGVLETAVKYGYGSNEAFTRAFRSFWGVSPSKLAKSRSFTDLYPVLNQKYYDGGTFMKNKFDLTQLYEKMQDKKNTYVCCFDIKHLDPINKNLGRNVGNAVIRRCVERIDAALKDGMFAFRIGGDEFIVATGYSDITQAEELRKEVTAANGEKITCDGIEAEVTLHSGIMLYIDETSNPGLYDNFMKTLLYEKMQDKKNTYVCCFDVKHLSLINKNSGRAVGDAVIRRCVERIDAALKDSMFAFRIGGDEFIVATGYSDIAQAEELRKEVTAANGEKITYNGVEAEVTMRSGIMLYSDETSNPGLYDDSIKTVYYNF